MRKDKKEKACIPQFEHIEYLQTGSQVQQFVYQTLIDSNVLSVLKEFTPILAGTYPIGIEIENSDLDIICHLTNKELFMDVLNKNFSCLKGYRLTYNKQEGNEIIIANFFFRNMEFEVFGQNKPVKEQNAYRHMINEYLILNERGQSFRQRIIELKRRGMKTEPAFAKELGLEGDPYIAMLHIRDEEIVDAK